MQVKEIGYGVMINSGAENNIIGEINHFENTAEQNLHQDLIIESIKTFGVDNYYLPRLNRIGKIPN